MPLPRESLRQFFYKGFLAVFFFFYSVIAFALVENQPIHFSGDKQVWDRKNNKVELFGHASVNQVGETLSADYITLDLKERVLDARGNCVYIASESVIWGDEMHFNLDTRTGTVIAGRVSNDRFTLRGEELKKLGNGRYQTHWGDYSTCKDCAPSWSLLAEDVDMEIEGYAYLSNVTIRVKDAPTLWLPYLVVPMKTRRQTGFIFPPLVFSGTNGAQLMLPFFWAINRSSDMTISVGEYTQRGHRLEWEGRYVLSPRNQGIANFYYLMDKTFNVQPNSSYTSRWALNMAQTQELGWGFEEKLRLMEVSDNLYPFYFPNDTLGYGGEAFLPSSLTISRASSDISGYVAIQRYRDLLYSAPNDPNAQQTQFDPKTVQALPIGAITTNDKILWDTPIVGGITLGFANFTRAAGAFDYDNSMPGGVQFGNPVPVPAPAYRPGVDPIREATRVSVTPSLYTTLRPWDDLTLVPSVQYRGYFYNFNNFVPNLDRGYLLLQADLSTQLERIYEFPDDPNIPRAKHLIRPILTYSYIPFINEDKSHPFLAQIYNAQKKGTYGYYFDDNDIVPYTYTQSGANYFVPQGHSLAYGLSTQWIRRRGGLSVETPAYQTAVEFSAGQAINFLEITNPQDPSAPHIFTRFFSGLNLNYDRFSSGATYYYYPDIPATTPRHTLSTYVSYVLDRTLHQKILTYDRSVSLGYTYNQVNGQTSNLTGTVNFSISDYLLPFGSISYGFQQNQIYSAGLGIQLQSPSRCWKFALAMNYNNVIGTSFAPDLSLNITGSGFGGVTDLQNAAAAASR